jgi:hypothetical protein
VGHFCRLCLRIRPNEQFSGSGHRAHVCRECARMPQHERELMEQEDELLGYLKQSHISNKNVCRLRTLAQFGQPRIRALAAIVLEVAAVVPYKKRRVKILARDRPDVLDALARTGLIEADHR